MKDFIKKFLGFSLGPIIGAIVGFITVPLTTYFVMPDEFGKSSMFTLMITIITAIACLGIDQAFIVYYNEEKEKEKLLFNALLFPFLVVIILGFVIALFAKEISFFLFSDASYTGVVYSLILVLPVIMVSRFILMELRMQEQALKYSFFSALTNFGVLIATAVLLLMGMRDFLVVVYSYIFAYVVSNIILIALYHKNISLHARNFDGVLLKKLMKYGLPMIFTLLIGWALNSMSQIFLRYFSSYEELGYYSAALRIVSILLVVQTAFTSFWTPTAFRWKKEKMPKEYFDMVGESVSLIMGLFLLGVLLFKDVIPLILSSGYQEAVYILPFLLFYPIFYTMSETTVLGIYFEKKSYLTIYVSILSLLANLILIYVCVPIMDAKGAALATGVSYLVFFWGRTMISRRLWYKMKLIKYVCITILLFVVALINTFVREPFICLIVNILGILIIMLLYRNIILYFWGHIKGLLKKTR